ncbi:MAG: sugar ABC transporter permease, partial [Lachnospiraceae bacterium]|nr:sugar ABC transporter permease [Lachnospiraceae bacterium]
MKVNKKSRSISAKQKTAGWLFLLVASVMIFIFSFYPMFSALIMSLKTGSAANMKWASPVSFNYTRMFQDKIFMKSVGNTFLYLIIQVPIMLVLAILLAQLLNNKDLKFKGLFRTCVFLPCAISLVSYAVSFRTLFATQGLV